MAAGPNERRPDMECPDCDDLQRREFLKTVARTTAGLAVTAVLPNISAAQQVATVRPAAVKAGTNSETLAATLYKSLSPQQRSRVAFPFGHPLRSRVEANWRITPIRIGEFFTPDQQAMTREIFRDLHNPEFYEKVMHHIREDGGSLENYSVALFGEPGSGAFEFVLTGRHCTVRCDGDSVPGYAFGGPIFYGHASQSFNERPDHPGNVYWYQAQRANEVFKMLDGKQRAAALLGDARRERSTATVELKQQGESIPGLPVSSMTRDQRELVDKVLADLLLPFRQKDREEAMRYIHANGGAEALSMSFYRNLDVGNDGVWDVWQLESPRMVWYFRGYPHVHVWVNIRA
jgi:hypothetical protein